MRGWWSFSVMRGRWSAYKGSGRARESPGRRRKKTTCPLRLKLTKFTEKGAFSAVRCDLYEASPLTGPGRMFTMFTVAMDIGTEPLRVRPSGIDDEKQPIWPCHDRLAVGQRNCCGLWRLWGGKRTLAPFLRLGFDCAAPRSSLNGRQQIEAAAAHRTQHMYLIDVNKRF